MPRAKATIAVSIAACLCADLAQATTGTANMSITLVVPSSCAVQANPLNFPPYTGALDRVTTTISVVCTNTTPFTIALDPGLASGATVTTRRMVAGADTVNYALFGDSAYSQNWGQTPNTDTVAGTGTGSQVQFTVYGQIAAGQYAAPGAYSDTITATVNY